MQDFRQLKKVEMLETEELSLFQDDNSFNSPNQYGNYSMRVHIQLDTHAWIEFFLQWLKNSQELFNLILTNTPWKMQQRMMYDRKITIPRLFYGYRLQQSDTPTILQNIGTNLSHYYGHSGHPPFISAGLCLYRNENDSVAWHGDSVEKLFGQNSFYDHVPQVLVAILSLGTTRPLLLRPKDGGGSRKFIAHSGDLLVMGGACQTTWEHCIPKLS